MQAKRFKEDLHMLNMVELANSSKVVYHASNLITMIIFLSIYNVIWLMVSLF